MAADADWVLTRDEGRLILGAQANLWTEYVPDEGDTTLPPAPPPPSHTRNSHTRACGSWHGRISAGAVDGLAASRPPQGISESNRCRLPALYSNHYDTCVLHIVVACKREWESRQPDAAPATATAAPLHALHASRWPEGGRGRGAATAEYMLLPRMCATAEVLWSPAARKDWRSFRARLPHVLAHCEALGIRHRPLT